MMPPWQAENLNLTSSLVHLFTSFEAAQSSRTTRVLVPSKKHTYHFQPKFNPVLLADDNKKPQVCLSELLKGLVVSEYQADELNVIEFAAERATKSV